ncbi:hypothetical protein P3S67_002976 [Capsicum chacoense]
MSDILYSHRSVWLIDVMDLTANYCSYIYLCVSAGLIQVMNGFFRACSATGASPLQWDLG